MIGNIRAPTFLAVAAAVAVAVSYQRARLLLQRSNESGPYGVLGVPRNANREAIVKAYRSLAKRWHPDMRRGDPSAEAVFSTIANAYDVLLDPEKRDVYDRLGMSGLERLRDGDPSVKKDWLPPDEVLRRIHNDGEEAWLEYIVTTTFALLGGLLADFSEYTAPTMRWMTGSEFASVTITATDSVGAPVAANGYTSTEVTFKFTLSGKSLDFREGLVQTDNCKSPRFLGMKTTFYLLCAYNPGKTVSVSVPENTFTVTNRPSANARSESFAIGMT